MIVLLDENFPLRFYTRPQRDGLSVEHIILTHRGIHDREILSRLQRTVNLLIKLWPRCLTTRTTVSARLRRVRAGNRMKITPPVLRIPYTN